MALETGTYISDLVSTNPVSSDNISQGDDHIRLLKSTIKATFPNITGAVTPTHTDLNKLTASGSPQFSTIELGHASDTTITRSAAGVIAVEGGVVPKENRANTFSADQTFSGRVLIGTTSPASGYVLQPYGKIYAGDETDVTPDAFWSGQLTIRGNGYAGGLSLNATGMWVGHNSSGRALLFATDETERMRIDSSGNVGIGTTSPGAKLVIDGGTSEDQFRLGTGSNYYRIGRESASTGFLTFYGTQTGATGYVFSGVNGERMRIDSSGNVLVTGSGGLGYGTGSGGTVTQATSKSTTVTLNKANGNVTTHNSALAAGASVEFSVTNSSVAVTDTVILSGIWGVSANYRIELKGVYGGGFAVRITNITAGSLSEAIGINFAVIKATTS